MEESLYSISTDFPTPPTLDTYFSLKYDSGQYYPVRAGARFPPPPTLDEYDNPSTFRNHNHLDFHKPLKHVRNKTLNQNAHHTMSLPMTQKKTKHPMLSSIALKAWVTGTQNAREKCNQMKP